MSKKSEIFNHSYNRPLNDHAIIFLDMVPGDPESFKDGYFKSKNSFLLITEKERDVSAHEQTTGILLAVGSTAFKDWPEKPKLGDRVKFQSYVGGNVKEDHRYYRLLVDKEIRAIYDRPETSTMNK